MAAAIYYDFTSPYAYMATARIEDLIPDIEYKPFAYPFILQEIGKTPWPRTDQRESRLTEIRVRVEKYGLPELVLPDGWPVETWSFTPLRAALFADERGKAGDFTRAAFAAAFQEGKSLAELETTLDAAASVGLDPAEVADAVQRPDIKQRLKDITEEARAAGVTGIPTVAVDGELFWGDDRLEDAAAAATNA